MATATAKAERDVAARALKRSSSSSMRRLASHGYVVALQNFRGCQQSEGTYQGYRALGFGEHRDNVRVERLAILKGLVQGHLADARANGRLR